MLISLENDLELTSLPQTKFEGWPMASLMEFLASESDILFQLFTISFQVPKNSSSDVHRHLGSPI